MWFWSPEFFSRATWYIFYESFLFFVCIYLNIRLTDRFMKSVGHPAIYTFLARVFHLLCSLALFFRFQFGDSDTLGRQTYFVTY